MKVRQFFIAAMALLFVSFSAWAQDAVKVSGKVYDSEGIPLIGVGVLVKEQPTVGVITDADGQYTIEVVPGQTLMFSSIGYSDVEIVVDAKRAVYDVTLETSTEFLDKAVVIGYGTRRKGGISAAVSSVDSEDIARSTSTTTSGALVGKVAGITSRQKSGEPGATANLQIRNMGDPLYVIDGIMTDAGSFNNLDINDIENISVLKDGSAAIYGMKAANGVILVTTKTGKKNQAPTVSINAYTGWQQWTTFPDLMNAYEYNYAQAMQKVNRGILNDANSIANQRIELEKWKLGIYNPETGEDYRSFDWYENYVSQAAPQYYVNASVSGGSERANYYVSFSWIDQDAVLKDYNFNRFNLQANLSVQVAKRLKVGYQMSGKIEDSIGPALTPIDQAAGAYQLIRNSLFGLLPTYRPYANDNPDYINFLTAHDSRNMAGMDIEHAGYYQNVWRTIRNTVTLDYETPLPGLTAKALFSYFFANNNYNRNEKGYQEYTYDRATDSYIVMWDKAENGGANRTRTRDNYYDINAQFLVNYDNTFAEKHNVTATVGFECYQRQQNYLTITQSPVDNPYVDLVTTSENNTVGNNTVQTSTASAIFRAGYNFDQRYIIDFAGRYDGSWRFPAGKRWAFFPSVSAAWRISDEPFFKNSSVSDWFSNAKLRVSYGEVGDDNVGSLYPDFAFLSGYNYNQGSSYIPNDPLSGSSNSVVTGSKVKGEPITTLSWMTSAILDIGIELGFFDNKLNFEFDVFQRKRYGIAARPDDLLFPYESGLSALPQNLNSDMNVGLDFSIGWEDKVDDFHYSVGANMTLARRKNGEIYGETFFNAYDKYWFGGSNRWVNVVNGNTWMYDCIGVFQSQEEIDSYPVDIDGKGNTTLLPGDLIFRDYNSDGVINDYDRRPLGYAGSDYPYDSSQGNKNPLLSLGFTFAFDWKGIDFAADFAGGFMNTWCPDWFCLWGSGTSYVANGFAYNSLNVWRHEDILDPTSPWVPGDFPAFRGDSNPSVKSNNFYNVNVRYLRLRNLVIGYTLPQRWTQKARISKCRFYVEGTNLFSFDNLKRYGIDPEVSGVQGADYPQNRVLSVGVNITFN